MGSMLCQANGASDMAATHATDTMISHQAVTIGEGRLVQQRHEPIRKISRMDQHNWLPGAFDFVFKFDVFKGCAIHLIHDLPLHFLITYQLFAKSCAS